MSWDAYIYRKEQCRKCGEPHPGVHEDGFYWNYTSNTTGMLQAAAVATGWTTPEKYVGELLDEPMDGAEFCARMQPCIDWMREHEEEMAGMNPTNGWGNHVRYRSALQEWVNAVRRCVAEYGGAMTRVSR